MIQRILQPCYCVVVAAVVVVVVVVVVVSTGTTTPTTTSKTYMLTPKQGHAGRRRVHAEKHYGARAGDVHLSYVCPVSRTTNRTDKETHQTCTTPQIALVFSFFIFPSHSVSYRTCSISDMNRTSSNIAVFSLISL